ncbi:hypothetical protein [Leptospira weilii]
MKSVVCIIQTNFVNRRSISIENPPNTADATGPELADEISLKPDSV